MPDLPWSNGIFGGQSDLIDFARDVNGRTINYGMRHYYSAYFGSDVTEDIPAKDQANIIYQYVSNPQVVPTIGGVVHYDSATWTGVKAFFSHPNTQFVLVAGAAAIAGPAGWAAAGALTSTITTVGGLTVTAAGAAQASLVVGSAWAIARAGDNVIGNVVDSDGDGVGDRTFGEGLVDRTTGDQSRTNDILTSADIAVFIVEVGPGIFNMVRGAVGFVKQAAPGAIKSVKSLGEKVTTLLDRQSYCFAPETLVSTNSGAVRIETIECGDHVAAYDFESGQINYYEVIDTHRNEYRGAWVEIKLGSGEAIGVTANHPFWVVSGEDLESRPIPVHDDSELVEQNQKRTGTAIDGRVEFGKTCGLI